MYVHNQVYTVRTRRVCQHIIYIYIYKLSYFVVDINSSHCKHTMESSQQPSLGCHIQDSDNVIHVRYT